MDNIGMYGTNTWHVQQTTVGSQQQQQLTWKTRERILKNCSNLFVLYLKSLEKRHCPGFLICYVLNGILFHFSRSVGPFRHKTRFLSYSKSHAELLPKFRKQRKTVSHKRTLINQKEKGIDSERRRRRALKSHRKKDEGDYPSTYILYTTL